MIKVLEGAILADGSSVHLYVQWPGGKGFVTQLAIDPGGVATIDDITVEGESVPIALFPLLQGGEFDMPKALVSITLTATGITAAFGPIRILQL